MLIKRWTDSGEYVCKKRAAAIVASLLKAFLTLLKFVENIEEGLK